MKVKYIMTKSICFDCAEGRIGYGIAALIRERGVETVVEEYRDISPDFEKVKAFVKLCNRERLSLIHLADVTEDFVSV